MNSFPRRTLVRAAAWSAPVIAIAVAAPAASASGEPAPDGICNVDFALSSPNTYVASLQSVASTVKTVTLALSCTATTSAFEVLDGAGGSITINLADAATFPTGSHLAGGSVVTYTGSSATAGTFTIELAALSALLFAGAGTGNATLNGGSPCIVAFPFAGQ